MRLIGSRPPRRRGRLPSRKETLLPDVGLETACGGDLFQYVRPATNKRSTLVECSGPRSTKTATGLEANPPRRIATGPKPDGEKGAATIIFGMFGAAGGLPQRADGSLKRRRGRHRERASLAMTATASCLRRAIADIGDL